MKLLLVLCLLGLARAQPTHEPVARYYHESYGIPHAAFIKAAEEATDFDGSRIVGGANAVLGQGPEVAGLLITLTTGATSVCGGALVSNTRVLTAASCWWDGRYLARTLVVVLGSMTLFTGGTRSTVHNWNIVLHPNYDTFNLNNNIAVITIPVVGFTANIRNIALPSLMSPSFAGTQATVRGYGAVGHNVAITNAQRQRVASMYVISNDLCQTTYGADIVRASVLCADPESGNVCSGDVGSPLVVAGAITNQIRTLVGITSFWAYIGCDRGLPSGFTRVSSFTTWIQERL